MVIFGLTGHGKTQLGLTMAVAIVKGEKFLGKFECRRGRVAYITTDDMGLNEVQEKFRKADSTLSLFESHDLFHVHFDDNIDILKQPEDTEWAKKIRDLEPAVVFVDVISGTHFLDEKEGSTPPKVYQAWRHCLGEKPAIVYLMHSRKPDREGKDHLISSLSGHHGWGDKVSSMLHIAKVDRREGWFKINFPKIRGTGNFPFRETGMECVMDEETMLLRHVTKKSREEDAP